jgi:hypothetical protein
MADSHMSWCGLRILAALCALTIAGCGSAGDRDAGPSGAVSGTVTFEGQPVTEGSVQFYSEEAGSGGTGSLDQTGRFTITEPIPVGTYKVSITPPEEPAPESETGEFAVPKEYSNIPESYRSELTTSLTADVTKGDNTVEFDLKP